MPASETVKGEIKRAIRSLMVYETGGDVHDVINMLRRALGLGRAEGNFLDGWTERDNEEVERGE